MTSTTVNSNNQVRKLTKTILNMQSCYFKKNKKKKKLYYEKKLQKIRAMLKTSGEL